MAQTKWNVATGSWLDSGNWTAGLPNNTTDAIINNGGTSQVMLPGAQAQYVSVGDTSSGNLLIANGGTLTSSRFSRIGVATGSEGAVAVSGSGASWIHNGVTQNLTVGERGEGHLTVSGGGAVYSSGGSVGYQAGSEGIVVITGSDSIWQIDGGLTVGNLGPGTVTVLDGGTILNDSSVQLGFYPSVTGSVEVSGSNSLWDITGSLTIGRSGIGQLTISNGATVKTLFDSTIAQEAGSFGTVTVAGPESAWILQNGLEIGSQGTAEFQVASGATVLSNDGLISTTSKGTVTGAGSTWDNDFSVTIRGELNIVDGGKVSNSNGTINSTQSDHGMVRVTGTDSRWLNTGDLTIVSGNNGNGILVVNSAGLVETVGDTYVRKANGSGEIQFENGTLKTGGLLASFADLKGTGTIDTHGLVSNVDLEFNQLEDLQQQMVLNSIQDQNIVLSLDVNGAGSMGAGFDGPGSLTISNSVGVASINGFLGYHTGSTGTARVTGNGTTWTNSGFLEVGHDGSGELIVENGGAVLNLLGTIGARSGSNGVVTVSGNGSSWTSTILRVGSGGSGTLLIEEGGFVSNTEAYIARSAGMSSVSVSGSNAQWLVTGGLSIAGDAGLNSNGGTGSLFVGPDGTVTVGTDITLLIKATINLEGGTLSTAAIKYQGTGGQFNWTSGTLHVGTYNGNLANPGGTLAPGQSPGSTTVTGSYTQGANATLEIELGGLVSGTQHDFVSVTGATSLNGELTLALLGDYIPLATDTFTVLSSTGALTGTFTNIANAGRLDTTDGRGSFLVHYGMGSAFNSKQIVLTDFAITGDYNGDGVVNAADYVLWRDADGTTTGYTGWQSTFGLAAGQGSGQSVITSVPEPAPWQLALVVIGMLLMRHRPMRRH